MNPLLLTPSVELVGEGELLENAESMLVKTCRCLLSVDGSEFVVNGDSTASDSPMAESLLE